MDWLDRVTAELANRSTWGYTYSGPSASEPAALASIALTSAKDVKAARRPLDWLESIQGRDGSVGVTASQREPGWPTAWALAAWTQYGRHVGGSAYASAAAKAAGWLLSMTGDALPKSPEFGHDVSLVGWPWVQHTHSWLEPTALAVLALRQAGYTTHARVSEGASLLNDRLLIGGGANYGNTIVLGQELRGHVQPTGMCLLALNADDEIDGRIARSVEWLCTAIGRQSTAASLAYAMLGLSNHGQIVRDADDWLRMATLRELSHARRPYQLALCAWAASRWRQLTL